MDKRVVLDAAMKYNRVVLAVGSSLRERISTHFLEYRCTASG